jgi:hypothetical protein
MKLQLPTHRAYVCASANKTASYFWLFVAEVPHTRGDDPLFTQFSTLIPAHAGRKRIARNFAQSSVFFLDFPTSMGVYCRC